MLIYVAQLGVQKYAVNRQRVNRRRNDTCCTHRRSLEEKELNTETGSKTSSRVPHTKKRQTISSGVSFMRHSAGTVCVLRTAYHPRIIHGVGRVRGGLASQDVNTLRLLCASSQTPKLHHRRLQTNMYD